MLAINLFPLSVPRKDEKGRYLATTLLLLLLLMMTTMPLFFPPVLRDGGWEEKENNDVPTLLVNAVRYAMNHATAVPRTRHRG